MERISFEYSVPSSSSSSPPSPEILLLTLRLQLRPRSIQSMATFPTPLFSIHHQTPKRPRLITSSAAGNGRRPWWAPLFHSAFSGDQCGTEDLVTASDSDEEAKDDTSTAARIFSSLTPEKARVMRRKLRATKIWHDAMYHSAIASRLASPDQG
ncbi:uncharacterized protein LOC110028231 [Phalaenopsis equestris]|uniref:uncharacterized protein LOC110028231 n=1 Tax=Phalaenopsis equestris TaxID=78828 RepID=UPI0009E3EACD|nr:uncharacterized protein LOC110028231 [Phalaenopsis equestris]